MEGTSKAPVSNWPWVRSGPVHIVLLRAGLVGKMGSDHIYIYVYIHIYIYLYDHPAGVIRRLGERREDPKKCSHHEEKNT